LWSTLSDSVVKSKRTRFSVHTLDGQGLGQPFVIENRPGAATNIATQVVASAPANSLA
jgi:hypothetical protein